MQTRFHFDSTLSPHTVDAEAQQTMLATLSQWIESMAGNLIEMDLLLQMIHTEMFVTTMTAVSI